MVGQTSENFKSPVRIDSTGFVLLLAAMSSLLTLTNCQNGPNALTAEVPLHLEDHLDDAVITTADERLGRSTARIDADAGRGRALGAGQKRKERLR